MEFGNEGKFFPNSVNLENLVIPWIPSVPPFHNKLINNFLDSIFIEIALAIISNLSIS